jgi:hypothetical protein
MLGESESAPLRRQGRRGGQKQNKTLHFKISTTTRKDNHMPRTSTAALSVVAPAAYTQLPPPPDYLSAAEQAEWRAITATMPPTWFTRECHAALAGLTMHTCRMRKLGAVISANENDWLTTYEGIKKLEKMTAMLRAETASVRASLRIMRLAQISRMEPDTAQRHASKHKSSYYDRMGDDGDD